MVPQCELEHQHCREEGCSSDEVSGRPHYGATGAGQVGHGRPRQARGGRARRSGDDGHARLSGVPEEGDETDERGDKGDDARGRFGKQSVPPRMFFSLLVMAMMAPIVVLGPALGREALALPSQLPAHRWLGAAYRTGAPNLIKGAHLAQISQKGILKLTAAQPQVSADGMVDAVKDAAATHGGDDLLRTLATIQQSDDAMMGGPLGPEHVRMQQTQQGTEIVKVGRRSIWNYGPFVFTLGVMVSILIKLLIAQPLAKVGTDLLLMWAGTQESNENCEQYYGYVYLERDEKFGTASQGTTSSVTSAKGEPSALPSSTVASEAVTPRHSFGESISNLNSRHNSADLKRSSSGKKKWPVTLDLPEHGTHGAPFAASLPQPAASQIPLLIFSPDSALTAPGESLMTDLPDTGDTL